MTAIYTKNAPDAIGPYSQGIVADGKLYTSGQIPVDPVTGKIPEGIKLQTEQVMKNLKALLLESGSDFGHVIKTTCFLSDMGDFAEFNEIYEKYFIGKPARSCVAVKTLPKNVLTEVELISSVV